MDRKATDEIVIVEADLASPTHARAVVDLIDAYARDELGNGRPLASEVREALIPALRQHPTTRILLAYDQDAPVGAAICFLGFSTFAAKPLLNIHDLVVLPTHRDRGIGRRLLTAVETKARSSGCCKLTLEVLANNPRARHLYQSFGFAGSMLVPENGASEFWAKPL